MMNVLSLLQQRPPPQHQLASENDDDEFGTMTPEIHSSSVSTEHGHPPPPLPQPHHLTCNIDQCGRRGFEELVDCIYQKGPTLVSLSLHWDGHCQSIQDVQRLLDTLAGVVAPRLVTVAFYDFNSREEASFYFGGSAPDAYYGSGQGAAVYWSVDDEFVYIAVAVRATG
jgi:hypothetical protein